MSNKIVKGTVLLTGAAIISKFLGMIYAIPFNELVGPKGIVLYYFAYNPYTILLGISTIGIPSAVSKIVSKYNSLGYEEIGFKVFRVGMFLMFFTGVFAFLGLYFSSDWLATKYAYDDGTNHDVEVAEIAQVIKAVSFALLIIPAMSIIRGFFQGNQHMKPTATSQIIEQIVRIAFVLVSTFIIVKMLDGTIVKAVSYATFGAFVGAVASIVVLFIFWRRFKTSHQLKRNIKSRSRTLEVSYKELLLELLYYAGPFVLVGIAIPLYQAIDSFTFNKAMYIAGYGDIAKDSLAAINFNGHKLILIPVTLATGLSLTIIPALTKSFTVKNFSKLNKEINQSIQIVLLLVIPAVVGLSTLAFEAYGSLYGMAKIDLTSSLLMWYAPVALFFALFTVTAAILQGINEQRFAIVSLAVGFLIKMLLNSFFIHIFSGKGAIFATAIAVIVAVTLNLWWIKRSIHFSYMNTIKRSLFMFLFSFIMFIVLVLFKNLFGNVYPYEDSRGLTTIVLFLSVIIGAVTYLWLIHKSTLMYYVLGDFNIVRKFNRRKR